MAVLTDLLSALAGGGVQVVDLTAPLSASTPVLQLPEPFANTTSFRLEEISRYDDRGPAWYWNDIHTGEHVGTHVDAPIHWLTGKDGVGVDEIPLRTLDFLLGIDDVRDWEAEHGPLPDGGWLLYRTGWDARSGDQESFLNGQHSPGVSPQCAQWLAQETPIVGFGVETVGTDAGRAAELEPMFPCHNMLLGAGKFGLTQLRNLAHLPPTGAVLVVSPLPIVGGSGSPARVYAFVERS
jgi:kynurenine formamidase